jgi:hypothetical protein
MRKRRHLADWLDSFQKAFENTESPEKYVYWTGVATIGAALQRNVKFDEVTFRLYPNFYVILIGPPAVKKTTAINFGVDRLRKVEGINVGPSTVTWQYLVDKLKDIQTASPEEMARTGEATKESCPIVLPAGELGTLIDFDDRASIDFFTNAWDSPDVYDKGTRIMGDQLLNGPCPTIIAGTTPQWIKDNIKGATRGGGFISRCIMPYANKPRKTITYPSRHVKADHSEQLSFLEHDLACISTLKGNYTLSPEAIELGEKWHTKTTAENYDPKHVGDDKDNWANRRYSHVHKLAMIIAASKRDALTIEKGDLQESIDRIEEIHKDFNNVFALLDQRRETKGTREIEAYLAAKGTVLLTDVMVQMRQKFTKKEITDALEVLLAGRIIVKDTLAVTAPGGGIVSAIVLVHKGTGGTDNE